MNFIELRRELRNLVEKAIKDNMPRYDFERAAKKISEKYLSNDSYKKMILESIIREYEFTSLNSLLKGEAEVLAELFTSLNQDFAKTKKGIVKGVVDIVKEGLKKGEFSKTIQGRLEGLIGRYRNYANTITVTALGIYDQIVTTKDDDLNTLYEYMGGSPQRPFCKHMIGKRMTRKEINEMSNRLGYDVFTMRGKWRCKHWWQKVVK